MKPTSRVFVAALALTWAAHLARPQNASAPETRLLTAKTIYVEHMPAELDQWIIEDLKAWGRYQIISSEQGADLVLEGQRPDRSMFTSQTRPPLIHRGRREPPVLSLRVVDWVSGAQLWHADILDAAPKKNKSEPAGPNTEVRGKHMTPDQIATRSVDLLRRYVESLQQKKPQ